MGKTKPLILFLSVPVFFIGILNFILTFTPETGFDALWYHLTLPKLLLLKGQYYFPGGLLYYSVMPRLTETLFVPLIYFFGATGPKLLQFFAGLGVCFYIYKITKHFKFSQVLSWVAISTFYCTWLVSWESSSGYIDLFRAFLESAALYYFLVNKKFMGGVLLGLALGTKWLAVISVVIYSFVFGLSAIVPAFLVSFPWFFIAYYYTNNPVFPLFNPILQNGFQDVIAILKSFLLAPYLFTFPFDDFISPIIGFVFIMSVLAIIFFKGQTQKIAIIGVLGSLSTLILNPPSSRFLIPFLPALVISATACLNYFPKNLQKSFIFVTVLSSILILTLRLFAFQKYIPYLLKNQSQNEFLTSLSARLPSTFIDSDDFVAKNIPQNSSILIDKLHNLFYFPYNFDHTSWSKPGFKYDFLITENQNPKTINGVLINTNQVGIQIFKLN